MEEKKKLQKDFKKLAKRESLFSTLARKEGKGADSRYKAESKEGYKESAKDSKMESKLDKKFAEKRKTIAMKAKAKLKG